MSNSPALPNRNASVSNPSGMRALNVIAAAANGGVPQARIRRVLADVVESLKPLHAQGGVHGGIAMSTIGLDSSGQAHLLTPPLAPSADADNAARIDGYAAFEQYTDDPESPCGPWTDIYALSAVAHTMLVGKAPPPALDRCVKDTSEPLSGRDLGAYDPEFLQAVDLGLSMKASARPGDVEAFAQAFGLVVAPVIVPPPAAAPSPEPEVQAEPDVAPPAVAAPEIAPPAVIEPDAASPAAAAFAEPAASMAPVGSPQVAGQPAASGTKAGTRVPLLVLLGVLAALALGVYMWVRPDGQFSASSDREAPVTAKPNAGTAPEPEPPIPTPPALSDLGRGGSATESGVGAASPTGASEPSNEATASGASGSNLSAGATPPTSSGAGDTPSPEAGANNGLSPEAAPNPAATPQTPSGAGPESVPAQTPNAGQNTTSGGEPGSAGALGSGTAPTPGTPAAGVSIAGGALAPNGTTTAPSAPGTSPDTANGATPLSPQAAAEAQAAQAAKETPPATAQVPVRVSVRPWGEVIIDGRSRGISPPLGQVMLSPGRHQVTIRNPASSDFQTSITVGPGSSGSIAHVFE